MDGNNNGMNNGMNTMPNTTPVMDSQQPAQQAPMPETPAPKKGGSAGPVIGIIIILLILIAGALYYWNALPMGFMGQGAMMEGEEMTGEEALTNDTAGDMQQAENEIGSLDSEIEADLSQLETEGF